MSICYYEGDFKEEKYCDGESFVDQKADGEKCLDSYECLNDCYRGICGEEVEEKKGLISRIFSWIKGIFT